MTSPSTISEAISNDHNNLDVYADKIKSSKTLEEKTKWRNQFTWTLARHAISEELTMYPAMEKHLGQEGTDLTNIDRAQHQAVKTDLYTLQTMSPDSNQFIPALDNLLKDLHEHIEHEKNEDMPRLEGLLSREESKNLADQFVSTKQITPTRSHPNAPDKPYFENLAAMLAAPLDKFADLMRSFPEEKAVLEVSPKAVL